MITDSSTPQDPEQSNVSEDEKLLAVLAYIPFVCFVPFFKRDVSEFVAGHVRLGMALFVIEVVAMLLRFRFIWDLVLFICILFAAAGILHVFRGRGLFVPYLSDLFSRRF